jgi:hypothetical protein
LLPSGSATNLRSCVLLEVFAEYHVVGHDEAIEARGFRSTRTIQHVLPTTGILRAVGREIERELREPATGLIGRHESRT